MTTFIGDYKTFYKFFDGYARNKTLDLTRSSKSGICACCGLKVTGIQSAHKRGFERPDVVKNCFDAAVLERKEGIFVVDLDVFEQGFLEFSSNIENFHFLCQKCHKAYDDGNISEADFKHKAESIKSTHKFAKSVPTASSKSKRNQVAAICQQNGYTLTPNWNMASRNKGIGPYWCNPDVENLQHDWDFVLVDTVNNELLILRINKTDNLDERIFYHRNSNKLNLKLNPDTLRDKYSGYTFQKHLVKKIPLPTQDDA